MLTEEPLWVLRRLREDERLEHAEERLRKNFYHLWKPYQEAKNDPGLLQKWKRAPRGSQEWRKAIFCEQALRVLQISMRG